MNRIFVISGIPGAGKSSVSRALAQRCAKGVHLPGDDLREMVVSGLAGPMSGDTPEETRQFKLARGNAAIMACRYSQAGFRVCIDDVIAPGWYDADYAEHFTQIEPVLVSLQPRLEIALERNRTRQNKAFDTITLEPIIRMLHQQFSAADWRGWFVIDSSDITLDQTVNRILELAKGES